MRLRLKVQTEAVSSQGRGGDLLLIHETNHVVCHFIELETVVVIRVSEVSGVQQVDVSII